MPSQFAKGERAIGWCDRCGQRYKLKQLKTQILKQKPTGMRVCPECLDSDHPQLLLGSFPVYDPQALRDPRRDLGFTQSGLTVLGTPGIGSRTIYWGWNPVGGGDQAVSDTPNPLVAVGEVGTVTVT